MVIGARLESAGVTKFMTNMTVINSVSGHCYASWELKLGLYR